MRHARVARHEREFARVPASRGREQRRDVHREGRETHRQRARPPHLASAPRESAIGSDDACSSTHHHESNRRRSGRTNDQTSSRVPIADHRQRKDWRVAALPLDRIRAHSSLYRRDDTHSLDARGVHIVACVTRARRSSRHPDSRALLARPLLAFLAYEILPAPRHCSAFTTTVEHSPSSSPRLDHARRSFDGFATDGPSGGIFANGSTSTPSTSFLASRVACSSSIFTHAAPASDV